MQNNISVVLYRPIWRWLQTKWTWATVSYRFMQHPGEMDWESHSLPHSRLNVNFT